MALLLLLLTLAQAPTPGITGSPEGAAILSVSVSPVRTAEFEEPGQPPTYTGPERLDAANLGNITEAVLLGDFEATTSWAIGIDQEAGFRVFHLPSPSRVVVDVNH